MDERSLAPLPALRPGFLPDAGSMVEGIDPAPWPSSTTSSTTVGIVAVSAPHHAAWNLAGVIVSRRAHYVPARYLPAREAGHKTMAVRFIPVPGAKAGDIVDLGGLFGKAPVMEVRNAGASAAFVRFGGRIPAPLQSLGN